jgi:hypothetical protein
MIPVIKYQVIKVKSFSFSNEEKKNAGSFLCLDRKSYLKYSHLSAYYSIYISLSLEADKKKGEGGKEAKNSFGIKGKMMWDDQIMD